MTVTPRYSVRKFRASSKKIHCNKMGDNFIHNEQGIANMFNKDFVNVAANLKEPTQLSNFDTLRTFVDSKVHPVVFHVVHAKFCLVLFHNLAYDSFLQILPECTCSVFHSI